MAVGLPRNYRFKIQNALGQTITQDNGITVKARRVKLDSNGALSFESSEATILDNGTTDVTASSYFAGTAQDNSTDKWLGGDFEFTVTAPVSSSGDVRLFLERSTDGGTDWDDDGLGQIVAVLTFTTSGTKRRTFSL